METEQCFNKLKVKRDKKVVKVDLQILLISNRSLLFTTVITLNFVKGFSKL